MAKIKYMENKFNKGDLVEIHSSGHCWTSYEEKFKEAGMKNPQQVRSQLPKGTQGMVLNFIPRYIRDMDGELMVVILFENQTYLYGSKGIKIIQSAINEHYEIY